VPYLGTPPEGSPESRQPVQGCHVQRLRMDAPDPHPDPTDAMAARLAQRRQALSAGSSSLW
jgi:hypothetical protein